MLSVIYCGIQVMAEFHQDEHLAVKAHRAVLLLFSIISLETEHLWVFRLLVR